MNPKVYVVGGSIDYASWFDHQLVRSVAEADLVLFTGGTDVDSALYGEPRHPAAQIPDTERDTREVATFKEAVATGKHILGICRGAQLCCALSGGKLVQHQDHTGAHRIQPTYPYLTGQDHSFFSPADHHQAQFPWGLKEDGFKLLGFTQGRCSFHLDGHGQEMILKNRLNNVEVEDAYYPKTKALAIQSHPEWANEEDPRMLPGLTHYRKLLELHLSDKL
jgi:gamma-glutamyl-gamma-aminobutyrate hydrolase PuuD